MISAVPWCDLRTISARLRRDGICLVMIESDNDKVDLAEEIKNLIASGAMGVEPVQIEDGEVVYALGSGFQSSHPALKPLLAPPWYGRLAELYFGEERAGTVDGITISCVAGDRFEGSKPGNTTAHWDPNLALRLAVYLSDVTHGYAAFEYVPGTHHANHQIRLDLWRQGATYPNTPTCVASDGPFLSVTGAAGTAFVFDVSLTHRRGPILRGCKRHVSFTHALSTLGHMQNAGVTCPRESTKLWPQNGGRAPW